jgi:hypothetical protein
MLLIMMQGGVVDGSSGRLKKQECRGNKEGGMGEELTIRRR